MVMGYKENFFSDLGSERVKDFTIADKILSVPQQIAKAHSLTSIDVIGILLVTLLFGVFDIQLSLFKLRES